MKFNQENYTSEIITEPVQDKPEPLTNDHAVEKTSDNNITLLILGALVLVGIYLFKNMNKDD